MRWLLRIAPTTTYLSEAYTSKFVKSKEKINPDGSSEKESYSTENIDDDTNTKIPYAINKTNIKMEILHKML